MIHLVKGADSSRNQELRASALIFLKGTMASKDRLRREKPYDYELINQVWEIRNRHMAKNVPGQYILYLKCCQQEEFCHPLCSSQHNPPSVRFPDIGYLPYSVPDLTFQWGSSDCPKWEGQCYGHFLDPRKAVTSPLSPIPFSASCILFSAPGKPVFSLIRRFTIFTLSVAFSSTLKPFLSSVFGTIHARERFLLS